MTLVEFKRLMRFVPGATVNNIVVTGNRVHVTLKFKWYAKPIKKPMIRFLAEVFSYIHVPGTAIYFYDYKEVKKNQKKSRRR